MGVERESIITDTKAGQKPRFAIAMAAMLGPKTIYLPFSPVGVYRRIAEEADVNIDFWPVRPTPAIQTYFGLLKDADVKAIVSASTSYRAERNILQTLRHPNPALAFASMLFLPHRDKVKTVQAAAETVYDQRSESIPVVVYPETSQTARNDLPANKLVQPTFQEFLINSVVGPSDVQRYLQLLSIQGFCFDTLHSRFLFTDPRFRHLFETVMAQTKLVHISLGRTDMAKLGSPVDNENELTEVFRTNKNSEIARLLRAISNSGFKGTYVLEVPAGAIPTSMSSGKITRPANLSVFYRVVADSCSYLIQG